MLRRIIHKIFGIKEYLSPLAMEEFFSFIDAYKACFGSISDEQIGRLLMAFREGKIAYPFSDASIKDVEKIIG